MERVKLGKSNICAHNFGSMTQIKDLLVNLPKLTRSCRHSYILPGTEELTLAARRRLAPPIVRGVRRIGARPCQHRTEHRRVVVTPPEPRVVTKVRPVLGLLCKESYHTLLQLQLLLMRCTHCSSMSFFCSERVSSSALLLRVLRPPDARRAEAAAHRRRGASGRRGRASTSAAIGLLELLLPEPRRIAVIGVTALHCGNAVQPELGGSLVPMSGPTFVGSAQSRARLLPVTELANGVGFLEYPKSSKRKSSRNACATGGQ